MPAAAPDQRTSRVPLIMLTAKATEADRIVGLEMGADDYVTKPFSPRELVARVQGGPAPHGAPAGAGGVIRRGHDRGRRAAPRGDLRRACPSR